MARTKPKVLTVEQVIALLQDRPPKAPCLMSSDPEGNEIRPVYAVDCSTETEGYKGEVVILWPC